MSDDVKIAPAVNVTAATEEKTEVINSEMMLPRLDINESTVKISEDGMTAWLYLVRPNPDEDRYHKQELKDFLVRSGVVAGHRDAYISAMAKKEIYYREIIVAEGIPPVDVEEGYFEYTFEVDLKKAPKILEDGTVDYTSVNKIVNVHVGDKLAVYHPMKPGTDGLDIRGNVLTAKQGKDLPLLRGTAISRRDTEHTYFAEKEGKVELRDGKLDIQNTHEVFGDVDQTIGKIEFFGDVIINGNVEAGVMIRAGRNIEVRGSVEAANLFAGGDIILQRGVQGQQVAKISARGSVFAKFIEQAIVTAGGEVVADSIMNSRVIAEGKVTLSGKRGVLLGGYTHGLLGVEAVTIGNDAETRTVVHTGVETDVYEKGISLKKRENQAKKNLENLRKEVEELKKKASLYGDNFQQMLKITTAKISPQEKEMKEELAILAEEQAEVQAQIQKGKGAQIRVIGNIYRGSVVCVAQLQMPIENNTCFMSYMAQGGMIAGNVIVVH